MKTTNLRRCAECSRGFVPDPRVRQRQVTCGAEACQRARHAKQCRRWREGNSEAVANHYQDVVVPFRKEQPDYQRRWRWWTRLREIREETMSFGGDAMTGLQGLVKRANELSERTARATQTGVLAGEKLSRAVAVVKRTLAALEQLRASASELLALGL